MSTDAWIEEHWIGEAILPRPRRAQKLPALPIPYVPTCSRGNAALAHAQSRDYARHPGDGLSARQDGRNVVDQQARKLTQPLRKGWAVGVAFEPARLRSNLTILSAIASSVPHQMGYRFETVSRVTFCRFPSPKGPHPFGLMPAPSAVTGRATTSPGSFEASITTIR